MKTFQYVQAIVTNANVGSPEAIRFRGTTVKALDIEGAYAAGQAWAAQFRYHPETETVNDWVRPLKKEKPS